jgi:kinetochore protein NNF1
MPGVMYYPASNSAHIPYSSQSRYSLTHLLKPTNTIPSNRKYRRETPQPNNQSSKKLTPFFPTQKDFEALIRERNVIENLNALEELIQDASRRKARAVAGEVPPTPYVFPSPFFASSAPLLPHFYPAMNPVLIPPSKSPHLLLPTAILAAHLAPQLASTQSQLNAKLQTTQSQNATLYRTILEQRKEIERLMDGLETTVRDLEGADGRLGGELVGEGSLREVEMGGV